MGSYTVEKGRRCPRRIQSGIGIDWKALKSFVKRLSAESPLQRAIIFGSRARGDELIDSDYDLILVSRSFQNIQFTQRSAEVSRYWNLPENLEVLCYTPEEYARKTEQINIVSQAEKEGIEIRNE